MGQASLSEGRRIDLFTQKEPYSGKGINKSSDAFAPDYNSMVILYANVTYNEEPVEYARVAFEVTPPHPIERIPQYRVAFTNASGIAMINFTLRGQTEHPEEAVFGIWSVVANVAIVDKTVTDRLTFKVGWIVEIVSVATIDENLKPKTHFAKATYVGAELHIRNIAMLPKTATIIVTAYDAHNEPFDNIVLNDFNVEPGETYVFAHRFLNISAQAAIGNAMINASAYTAPPNMGGVPYFFPEVSAHFIITSRNVAVINVTVSSIDVIAGQMVNVTVTVTNRGDETESFSVNAYYGTFLINQTFRVESLSPNRNRSFTLVWNTTYVPAGSYAISAVAEILRGETETQDNIYPDGPIVTVRIPRIFMFPRELSIIALIVAAALALFGIVFLLTKRKKGTQSSAVTLSVDVLPD